MQTLESAVACRVSHATMNSNWHWKKQRKLQATLFYPENPLTLPLRLDWPLCSHHAGPLGAHARPELEEVWSKWTTCSARTRGDVIKVDYMLGQNSRRCDHVSWNILSCGTHSRRTYTVMILTAPKQTKAATCLGGPVYKKYKNNTKPFIQTVKDFC